MIDTHKYIKIGVIGTCVQKFIIEHLSGKIIPQLSKIRQPTTFLFSTNGIDSNVDNLHFNISETIYSIDNRNLQFPIKSQINAIFVVYPFIDTLSFNKTYNMYQGINCRFDLIVVLFCAGSSMEFIKQLIVILHKYSGGKQQIHHICNKLELCNGCPKIVELIINFIESSNNKHIDLFNKTIEQKLHEISKYYKLYDIKPTNILLTQIHAKKIIINKNPQETHNCRNNYGDFNEFYNSIDFWDMRADKYDNLDYYVKNECTKKVLLDYSMIHCNERPPSLFNLEQNLNAREFEQDKLLIAILFNNKKFKFDSLFNPLLPIPFELLKSINYYMIRQYLGTNDILFITPKISKRRYIIFDNIVKALQNTECIITLFYLYCLLISYGEYMLIDTDSDLEKNKLHEKLRYSVKEMVIKKIIPKIHNNINYIGLFANINHDLISSRLICNYIYYVMYTLAKHPHINITFPFSSYVNYNHKYEILVILFNLKVTISKYYDQHNKFQKHIDLHFGSIKNDLERRLRKSKNKNELIVIEILKLCKLHII